MARKHILVVSQYFHPEPFRINDMCREWVKRGYKVTVLTGIPNYPQGKFYDGYGWFRKRREEWNGVGIVRIPLTPRGRGAAGMALNYLSFVLSGFFWKSFTSLKADCVFIFEVSPMTQALAGVWYAGRRKIPCYLYVQDLWPENVEIVTGIHSRAILGPIGRMVDYIYGRCDRILATSPSFAEEIRKRVEDEAKVAVWPQYAEDFYRPAERRPLPEIPDDGSFKVIFTGNIGQAQGLEILPKTAALLKAGRAPAEGRSREVRFVIVGDGRGKDNFTAEIRRAGVEDMFIMVDRRSAERIPELLACCDAAFVSFMDNPLFAKTIPAKLQSYMACGMPVIASAVGETEKIVREAGCGICCPIGNPRALAEGILKLSDMPSLDGMRANAENYCREHFDKKTLMDEIECLFIGMPAGEG